MHLNQKNEILVWSVLLIFLFSGCDLFETSGEKAIKEDKYNGVRKNYSKDGRLLSAVTYKDSLRHGIAQNYYEDGTVQAEFTYHMGVKHGPQKVFYENGDIYKYTTYKSGAKHGMEKIFYEGRKLMAEIPWDYGRVQPGLKEYNKAGKLKSANTKIIFELVDETAFQDRFLLRMRLSDGSKVAVFSRYFKDYEGNYLGKEPFDTQNGVAEYIMHVAPGTMRTETLDIIAERTTSLGNPEVFMETYELSVRNKKRFR